MLGRFFTLSVLGSFSLAIGCSSPPGPTGSDAAEVRVARCPDDVKLRFGKPRVLRAAPTTFFDGSAVGAAERARIEEVMASTRRLTRFESTLELDRTTSGVCHYVAASPALDHSATFRTSNGKDIFQIFAADNLQIFAFPTSYGTDGLGFAAGASASLMASIPAPGPFSDGARRTVKIGSIPLEGSTEVLLAAGTNDPITDGPNSVTLVAKAPNVTADVAQEFLAHCTITRTLATATETKFRVDLEYELDDGFNGCSIELSNDAGYRADIDVGLDVAD